jgi:hypothetical protein
VIDDSAGGDFGFALRTAGPHAQCLNGHRLDLAGVTQFFSHALNMHATQCNLCAELKLDRRAWFEVDHREVRGADQVPRFRLGVEFVLYPPRARAGVGEIQVHFERQPVGRIRLQMCGVDRRAVVVRVEVKPSHRRRRLATLLVTCALTRGADYDWSTVAVPDVPEVRSFVASVMTGRSLRLGEPSYCSHMAEANGDFGGR